jgi:hypothetical protein
MESVNQIEVQQRAGEMVRLLQYQSLSAAVLSPLVNSTIVSEEQSVKIAGRVSSHKSDDEEVDDLLLLVMNDTAPRHVRPVQQEVAPAPVPQPAPGPVPAPAPPSAISPAKLFEKSDFLVYGQTQPNLQDQRQIALRLLFYGTGKSDLTSFKTEFQIQPGWQLNCQAPDGNVLKAKGGPPVSQILFLFNQTNAPLVLQLRVSFMFGSQPITETMVLNGLP